MDGMRATGIECGGGSRSRSSVDTAEGISVGIYGNDQREDGDQAIQELSGDEGEALLGEPLVIVCHAPDTMLACPGFVSVRPLFEYEV
jgi:hypothetical protein